MLFKSRQGESNPELFPRPCLRHLYPGGRQRLKQQHRRAEPGSTGRDSCCPGNDLPKADPGSGERDGSPSGGTQRCPSLPGAQKERERERGQSRGRWEAGLAAGECPAPVRGRRIPAHRRTGSGRDAEPPVGNGRAPPALTCRGISVAVLALPRVG